MSLLVGTPTLAASSAAGGGMAERGVSSRIRRLPSLHLCFHLRLLRPSRRFLLRQRHPLRRRRRSKLRQFDQSLLELTRPLGHLILGSAQGKEARDGSSSEVSRGVPS